MINDAGNDGDNGDGGSGYSVRVDGDDCGCGDDSFDGDDSGWWRW